MSSWRDQIVFVREWLLRVPTHDLVYHAYSSNHTIRHTDGPWEHSTYSRCGLLVEHHHGHPSHGYSTFHINVAGKFARPCRRCYR